MEVDWFFSGYQSRCTTTKLRCSCGQHVLKLEDIGKTSNPPMLSVHLMLFIVFLWVKAAYRNRNKSELDEIHIIRELKLDVWTQNLFESPEWEKHLLSSIQRMIARYNRNSRK